MNHALFSYRLADIHPSFGFKIQIGLRSFFRLLLFVLACMAQNVLAQNSLVRCYTHEHHQARMQQGQHGESEQIFEQWMSNRIADNSSGIRPEVITISRLYSM